MAKRATRAEWLERVRAWKASGKSRGEFAAKQAYSERSLGWWAWKLGSEGEALDRKSQSFELVELVTQPARSLLTMRVGAVEVLVDRGFDREVLGGVLDVLEARR